MRKQSHLLGAALIVSVLVHITIFWAPRSLEIDRSTDVPPAQGPHYHPVTSDIPFEPSQQNPLLEGAPYEAAAKAEAVARPEAVAKLDASVQLEEDVQPEAVAQPEEAAKPEVLTKPELEAQLEDAKLEVSPKNKTANLKLLRPTGLAQQLANQIRQQQNLQAARRPSAVASAPGAAGLETSLVRQPNSLPAHLSLTSPQMPQDVGQLLQAQEFKYASYFLRLRQQLAAAWWPRVQKVIDMHILGEQKALLRHRVSKLRVVLDRKGELARVQLIQSCGLKTADRAALQAVQAAAPFPNPPAGLMGPDKQWAMLWHFVIRP